MSLLLAALSWGGLSAQLFVARWRAHNLIFLARHCILYVQDGKRALDYLMSRPEVATDRIGMTGCSGGGTQTAYLSAVDKRIQAASVACYSSSFEVSQNAVFFIKKPSSFATTGPGQAQRNFNTARHVLLLYQVDFAWQGSADAEQVWPGGLSAGLNKADLTVSRAPHATQLLLTSLDQCFPLAGGRMCFADAAPAFGPQGSSSSANITKTEAEGPHGMQNRTRQALYGFMQHHLQKLTVLNTTEDFSIKPFKMSQVIALPTGK